jgi:phosphatidylglycerophosphate synthase
VRGRRPHQGAMKELRGMVNRQAADPAGRAEDDARGRAEPAKAAIIAHARPLEIEEPLNRHFVHPISRALVKLLIPTGISPNMVSVLSVVMMACACACYLMLPWPAAPCVGLVFHVGWHVFDGADGELARRTGRSSPIGEIVDGVCDHVSHLILYLTLGWLAAEQWGAWTWALTVISAASRALQAICYETSRRSYRRWVYGLNWIRQDLGKAERKAGAAGKIGVALAGVYLKLSELVRADDQEIEAAMSRLMQQNGPVAAKARTLYQAQGRGLVKRASWLSTNWETVGVFLSLLAGSSIYFLAFQAVVLNLIMASCVLGQKRVYARLAPQLEALARR